MQLAIRSHGFPMTESLRAYTERRLRFALRATLAGEAGSRSTGDPSLAAPRPVRFDSCRRSPTSHQPFTCGIHGAAAVSLPARVTSEQRSRRGVSSARNWIEPSAMATLVPCGWKA